MLLEALLEIVLICMLTLGGFYGYRKGLFRLAVAPLRVVTCLAFAFLLCKEVGDAIVSPFIAPAIQNYLLELFEQQKIGVDSSIDTLPTLIRILVNFSDLGGTSDGEITVLSLVNVLVHPLSTLISRIFAFVILFVLATLVIKIAIFAINSLLDKGFLGRINGVLGVVLSGGVSLFVTWGFVSVVDYLFHLEIFTDSLWVKDFVGGPLYRLFRDVSPVRLLLSF